jgi:hypothetical protein
MGESGEGKMRYVSVVVSGLVLGAALFSSCTCHEQVSQPPTLHEPPSGFHAAAPKLTPQVRAQAPTVTPAKPLGPQVAAGPSPTPPAEVPADWPKDVPIYKDAALNRVQNLANNAHNVIFSTSDKVPDITSFYQDTMTRAGWNITERLQRENHAFFKFEKGNMVANVTVAQDVQNPGKQIIAIMYEEQQPLPFDEF